MRTLLLCHFHSAEALGRGLESHTLLLGCLEQLDKTTGHQAGLQAERSYSRQTASALLPLGEAAPDGVDGFESGLLCLEAEWPWGLSHIKF